MTGRLAKPRIRRTDWWDESTPWQLEVPDQGDAYATVEPFPTFEAALEGLADWWANGNRASFLRHPGHGHDRRREVLAHGAK